MYSAMTRHLCFLLLLAAAAISLSSCSDTQSPDVTNNTGVSTIPWNRPEKWENGSQLPGGLSGSR